ncbi:MAG TPA: non-homologous end-joining DNA ligase [Chthoniobacterales bacterium]|nr:non-homologous end-joining DNA ligase [Chthoniobacterales bacterium]
MGLTEYKKKRDFKITAEPSGKPLPKLVKGACRFVIQKHDASRLHYDFRLEMEGVLKSWAVPKGMPWEKGEKHLAVEVEDHPVEYATFEGIIPQGQYGGGTVMVWDRGQYHVYGEDPLKALRDGRMHMVMDGEKLKGEWSLIRTRMEAGKPQWLLLKSGSSTKPLSKKRDDESVKTGRTMAQIAAQKDAEWQSNREEEKKPTLKSRVKAALKKKEEAAESESVAPKKAGRRSAASLPGASSPEFDKALAKLPKAKAEFIEPMKARLMESPPTGGDWSYELKFDGFRVCAVKKRSEIHLFSRNGNELRSRFPEVVEALKEFPADECVIDGEVVALDDEGRSSFQLLQGVEMEGRKSPVVFYVFDLMQLNGRGLTGLPLVPRKQLLAKICEGAADPIRYSGEIDGDASVLLKEVQRRGLEGLIGKLRDSKYEAGGRSGSWIKLKCVNEQEFVIGGFTPPQGARQHFGALLVGYYDKKKFLFAGKVGTGFNTKSLASLYKKLKSEQREDCPFADLPSKQGGQWVQGITPSMMRKIEWVNPAFVCQVKFAEWTRDAKLRQPVFLGLREDKAPMEVIREK